MGGDLASIHTDSMNDYFYSLTDGSSHYWIGFSDQETEGTFVWADGSCSDFTQWNDGEPNQMGDEDCTTFWSESPRWNDWNCGSQAGYICQKNTSHEPCEEEVYNCEISLDHFPFVMTIGSTHDIPLFDEETLSMIEMCSEEFSISAISPETDVIYLDAAGHIVVDIPVNSDYVGKFTIDIESVTPDGDMTTTQVQVITEPAEDNGEMYHVQSVAGQGAEETVEHTAGTYSS